MSEIKEIKKEIRRGRRGNNRQSMFPPSRLIQRKMSQLMILAVRGPKSDEEKRFFDQESPWGSSTSFLLRKLSEIWIRFCIIMASIFCLPIFGFVHLLADCLKLIKGYQSCTDSGTKVLAPPSGADYLLYLLLARRNRRETMGDLTEEFHEDVLPRFGVKFARAWYWKKALTAIMERNPIMRRILVGGGLFEAGKWIWKAFAG